MKSLRLFTKRWNRKCHQLRQTHSYTIISVKASVRPTLRTKTFHKDDFIRTGWRIATSYWSSGLRPPLNMMLKYFHVQHPIFSSSHGFTTICPSRRHILTWSVIFVVTILYLGWTRQPSILTFGCPESEMEIVVGLQKAKGLYLCSLISCCK